MSKVIMFARQFPAYHPKAGEQTFFVEKIWKGLFDAEPTLYIPFADHQRNYDSIIGFDDSFTSKSNIHTHKPKWHTIRSGNRFKKGDLFSPRVWVGKPYRSKQVAIAPDIEVKKTWEFECKADGLFYINNKWIDITSSDLPVNDGLQSDDMLSWFPVNKPFTGQIICWNENLNY